MKFYSAVSAALLLFALAARAQPTAFMYQGQLSSSNAPANGVYDFQFQIYNAASNVVAGPLTNAPVGVTNGLFTTTLDFGSAVFDGSALTLEIGVRAYGDTNAYTILSPRQPLNSVPYAIQAINASNAMAAANLTAPLQGTNITGTISDAQLSTNVALLNGNQTFGGANIFTGAVTATNPANVFAGAFTGSGSGLNSLPATNLTGTVPDARLSPNVPLLNISNNFSSSVTAALFTGAGHGLTNVPGAFFWVTIAGTSVQMQPNVGYICANDVSPVTNTLPVSPSVGDTFKVCGIGGAGWIIAQNAGQNVFAGNLSTTVGENWMSNGPSKNWSAIASSADGTKLAAVVNGGNIYTATNSAPNWTARATSYGNLNWSCIASSADGTKLIAAVNGGYIYASTDSGADWTTSYSTSAGWSCVASSANGNKLFAAVLGGSIYTNSGSGWGPSPTSTGYNWESLASSSDGTKLVAGENNGRIFTSTNSGATWLARTNVYTYGTSVSAVASSSDGTRLIAATANGQIYLSTDSGATWVEQTSISGQLTGVTSSADGSRLAAVSGGSSGQIYFSSDSGVTWMQLSGAPAASWSGIVSSADGSLLAATINGGNIYLSSQSSTTPGTAGYLSGAQHSAIELIYAGNGIFLPLNHEGTIRAH
ncbi:MAG TPA: sialidase family protein [Candidatus Aquilonibacter sp.]|nr:sialidase family protein [Candidatus Aquilonibacter sp.]